MLSSGSRRRALGVLLVASFAALGVGGALSVGAQGMAPLPLGPTTTTQAPQSTTTTTAPRETTTTTAPSLLGPQSTTTTAPSNDDDVGPIPAPPSQGGETQPEPGAPEAQPHAGDGGTAPAGAGGFPSELQALMNSVARTGSNNTKKLVFALSPLLQYGLTEAQAAVVGFGRFPVAGVASYSHDWWFPRFGPGWRLHQGTDIFAAYGTPVRAPVDGTVKITDGGLGGLSVYVVQPDGTYWYLTHLAAIPEGLVAGATVKTGQVVGFVGDSGNARGGPPHLHFEVHPGGGGAIDPKPVLDQFIADAVALAPQVVEAYAQAAAAGTEPADVVVAAPAPQAVAAALSPRAALLWTSAVSPTGGAIHLAEAEAARVASNIDWTRRDENEGPTAFDRRLAKQYAAWWVQPLVHPRLARFLDLG
jgi:murein DD-endopeptidase MepM/ murein hydrolase activator NlpD